MILLYLHASRKWQEQPTSRPRNRLCRGSRAHCSSLDQGATLNLAAIAGISKRSLIASFRSHFGLSPQRYLIQIKVNEARNLLRRGIEIADAASAVGFADQSHLTRHFRSTLGVTPARYTNDELSQRLQRKVSDIFEHEVSVFLVSTGSAANALSLATLTPPWGSVLTHVEAHINRDECGAPEFYTNGAKLVQLSGTQGKIDLVALKAQSCRMVGDVHSVQPSSVSISQATELGTAGAYRVRFDLQ